MVRCNQLWSLAMMAFGVGILVGSICQSAVLTTILALGSIALGLSTLHRRK